MTAPWSKGRAELLRSLDNPELAGAATPDDAVSDIEEQPIRNGIIMRALLAGCDPDIGTGPDEAVELGEHDPALGAVEANLFLDVRRNLDGVGAILRRGVGDRSD